MAAAWLHDIGYTPELATTQFHPLDGARYLRDDRVVNLVAHHSGARYEAAERGLEAELSAFPLEDPRDGRPDHGRSDDGAGRQPSCVTASGSLRF